MIQNLTCILCPNGCDLTVETDGHNNVLRGEGNIATSGLVEGGALPLASVRLTGPIPKEQIFAVDAAIHAVRLTAPVHVGQTVLANVLGLGVDVIATRNVEKV